MQQYYQDRFGRRPLYIPYGSEVEIVPAGETLRAFNLEPRKYFLFVGRLVPENCAHDLVQAFRGITTDFKCVIVGDAPYVEEYKKRLRSLAYGDPRIVFTGYVFGKGYNELSSHAYAFIETSSVGGTHPALLEAMAFGSCVVVNDTPENLETIGDAGFSYDGKSGSESLRGVLRRLLDDPELVQDSSSRGKHRANSVYSWEKVTDEYEKLFYELCNEPLPDRLL